MYSFEGRFEGPRFPESQKVGGGRAKLLSAVLGAVAKLESGIMVRLVAAEGETDKSLGLAIVEGGKSPALMDAM